MPHAEDAAEGPELKLPDWLVYTGFSLLALQLLLGVGGYMLGWSDPSAPTFRAQDGGKESEVEGRERRLSRNSAEDLVAEPEMDELYRRHSKGKGHGDGSDGDGEFKDSDDSAACWRAAVDAFRDALHGQAAAALPAPLLAYLNSGAFGERCGAVLGPDAAASLLPAAELSARVQKLQREVLVGGSGDSSGDQAAPRKGALVQRAISRTEFTAAHRVEHWLRAYGLRAPPQASSGLHARDAAAKAFAKAVSDGAGRDGGAALVAMARALVTANVTSLMLELTGSPALPAAPWGPESTVMTHELSNDLSLRAPLASDFTPRRQSEYADSEYADSEWTENQSAFGDVPSGLLLRRTGGAPSNADLGHGDGLDLDGSDGDPDAALPLDTLVLESPHGSLDLPLVLEAEGAARRRGTPAVLMARSAEDHQRWTMDASGRFCPVHCSYLALDVDGSCVEEGMGLVLWNVKVPLGPSQAWRLTDGGLLRATASPPAAPLVAGLAAADPCAAAAVRHGARLMLVAADSNRAVRWARARSGKPAPPAGDGAARDEEPPLPEPPKRASDGSNLSSGASSGTASSGGGKSPSRPPSTHRSRPPPARARTPPPRQRNASGSGSTSGSSTPRSHARYEDAGGGDDDDVVSLPGSASGSASGSRRPTPTRKGRPSAPTSAAPSPRSTPRGTPRSSAAALADPAATAQLEAI